MTLDADSGPNLLMDWHESTDSRRWVRAGIGSVVVHILLVLLAFWVAGLDGPRAQERPRNREQYSACDFDRPVRSHAESSQQKQSEQGSERGGFEAAPGVGTALASGSGSARFSTRPRRKRPRSAARPAHPIRLRSRLPPRPRRRRRPLACRRLSRPRSSRRRSPSSHFETPGQQGTSPVHGLAKLQLPKTSLEDAIHDVARGRPPG